MRFLTAGLTALSIALFSAAAFAADTEIDGDVEIDVQTGHVLTVAAGRNAKAETNVASVGKYVEIDGDFDADVKTGHLLTVGAGQGAEAYTNIGSIGK